MATPGDADETPPATEAMDECRDEAVDGIAALLLPLNKLWPTVVTTDDEARLLLLVVLGWLSPVISAAASGVPAEFAPTTAVV